MHEPLSIDSSTIEKWIKDNRNTTDLEMDLAAKGQTPEFITTAVQSYKKAVHAKRLVNGFILLGIGAFVGFLGCVLAITNPFPELYSLSLYGSTCLAILLIGLGMYYVLE